MIYVCYCYPNLNFEPYPCPSSQIQLFTSLDAGSSSLCTACTHSHGLPPCQHSNKLELLDEVEVVVVDFEEKEVERKAAGEELKRLADFS